MQNWIPLWTLYFHSLPDSCNQIGVPADSATCGYLMRGSSNPQIEQRVRHRDNQLVLCQDAAPSARLVSLAGLAGLYSSEFPEYRNENLQVNQ